jgi:hypothetical protein
MTAMTSANSTTVARSSSSCCVIAAMGRSVSGRLIPYLAVAMIIAVPLTARR